MVKYSMKSALRRLILTQSSILCLAAGFLLLPILPAASQVVISGPSTPVTAELNGWVSHHVAAKFRAKGLLKVNILNDSEMTAYLQKSDGGDPSDQSSHADDGEIDGIFEDGPPRITLLIPENTAPDFDTFAHEYGHYVWFELLTPEDRKRYEVIYQKQKAAKHLVTRYAETDTEEGFAEAFSAFTNESFLLRRRDPASYQFLTRWSAPTPRP